MEVVWTVAQMEKNTQQQDVYVDNEGVKWHRDYAAEMGATGSCSIWPMKSDGAGVHPDQIGKAMAAAEKMGVPTSFDSKTGQAIFESRAHRKKYLKAHGMHDRNAGYGD
tara:strand:- start:10025 stop:10351 length:327 start_codon:yes stop_codon:yes gene_type:complete